MPVAGPLLVAGLLAGDEVPPEQVEAGPTALVIVVLLAIGIVFLARSMIKHLKRVPASFDRPDPSAPAAGVALGTATYDERRDSNPADCGGDSDPARDHHPGEGWGGAESAHTSSSDSGGSSDSGSGGGGDSGGGGGDSGGGGGGGSD